MTLVVRKCGGLYHRYPRQTSPQSSYVELDCEGEVLRADWNGEIGNAVPFAVWHGMTLRWTIPCLRDEAADELLEELRPAAERVCAGYECVWDGHNHIGRLSEDATLAAEEIAYACEDRLRDAAGRDLWQVWDAADWLDGLGGCEAQARELGITPGTTDEELEELAGQLEQEAQADGVDLLEGIERHLGHLRRIAQEEEEATS